MSNRRMKLEPAQEQTLLRRYNRRCLACGTRRNIQIDHVVAVASGGADDPRNAQLLCGRCNKRKSDKTIDYRGWRGALPLRLYRRLNNMGLPMKTLAQFCMRTVLVVVLALAVLFVLPVAHPIQLAILAWITGVLVFVQSVAWLAVAGVVLVAATWVYSNMQMEAPDEYGQWRLPRSYLRKHPEIALQTNQQHQQIRIVQARYQVPHHYAPKFAAPAEAEQGEPLVAPMPLHAWFPTLAQHPAHVLLLGDTGSGKSTLARAMLAERAKTDKVLVLDPHANLNDWCGVRAYGDGRNFDEIERMIRTIHAEFERRFVPGADMGEPLTIFVDEVPAIADDNKAVIPMITKWLREGRKVGIRVCMLSQGGEVKTLGIEGQGSIRENFLFVRMGAFARGVEGIEPGTPYPAALVRGYRSDDPPAPLDTAGMPTLTQGTLPASVAWQPSVALLPTPEPVEANEWTPQHDAVAAYLAEHPDASQREVARHLWPGCDGGGNRGVNAGVLMRAVRTFQGVQHGAENTTREQEQMNQIRQLYAQGVSQNRIMARVFPDIKKGGSKAYYDARDIYRQAIGAIVPGESDEDEDEAGQ